MTWKYFISTGKLFHDGKFVATGYSGIAGPPRNNPDYCSHSNSGPIPIGTWTIGTAYKDLHRGPVVLPLSPKSGTVTFGRSGFLIHGDSSTGNASTGCIILGPKTRQEIASSHDIDLEVFP